MSLARLDNLRSSSVDAGGKLKLFLTVANKGRRRGTEVVQLYAAEYGYWHDASGAAAHRLRPCRPRAGGQPRPSASRRQSACSPTQVIPARSSWSRTPWR